MTDGLNAALMPSSLRVLLSPIRAVADGTRPQFDGAEITLTRHGGGESKASGSPQPAKLILQATFLDRAREPRETETRPLAIFEGSLRLRADGAPVFLAPTSDQPFGFTAAPQADEEGPASATSRRVLRFALAAALFEGSEVDEAALVVKLEPQRFAFMEVRAQLEIAGTIEAAFEVNDVLDVAITRTNPPRLVEGATIGIHLPLFDEIPEDATLVVTPSDGEPSTFLLRDGLKRGDGVAVFTVQDPQPGVLYSAEMRLAPSGPGSFLFQGVELHQLLAESTGASPGPLNLEGADALCFEAPEAETPGGEAVQGGPQETTEQQLGSFRAKAGTDVFA